ncbi:MAG TPA: sugar transporter, partial [Tenacibaculum sp.]|nr:sugar transporter [Tenacibaculum sp.]
GRIKTYDVDLRSNNLFTSAVYYLQQNDIIYVAPNKATSQSASANQNSGLFISIAGVIISIITLIAR